MGLTRVIYKVYYEKYIKIFGGFVMYNTKHNTKTMGDKYVLVGYELLKEELAKYTDESDFDERYYRLKRDKEICEEYLNSKDKE